MSDNNDFGGAGDHASDGHIDDDDAPELPAYPRPRQERPPSQRWLPIEADSQLRQKIKADPTINPDHLSTLDDLKLLLRSNEEKSRVFSGSMEPEERIILDKLLEVAITELEVEYATAVGVVNVLVLRALDIIVALKRQELGLLR